MAITTALGTSKITYPAVAEALQKRAAEVAKAWGEKFPETDVAAIFGRSIPALLAEVAAVLASGDEELPASEPLADSQVDAAPDSAQMLRGFQALGEMIVPAVAGEMHRELRLDQGIALHRELDRLMTKRVAAVADGKLARLRRIADSRAQYMSFLSHDLRGSLNGVVLMLEVMRRELEATPAYAESLEDITLMRRSILQSVAMMERYLLLDQMRQGKLKLSIVPLDAQAVAAEVAAELADKHPDNGAAVVVEVPAGTAVEADRQLLHTALLNLAENAVKSGSRSAVKIAGEIQAGTCILAVTDEGPGIAPERLRELLDPNRPRDRKDRGVGLALVHEAARLMAGRLEAQSQPDRGSVFMLILPTEHAGQKAVELPA